MKQQKITTAMRASYRKNDTIDSHVRKHRITKSVVRPLGHKRLRIVPLGGQNGIGEKNMIVLEYGNDALILDCGFELGIELPGINYAIPATEYLHTIKHKIRGYVISHGHLDHIGALIHIVPQFPAPIFGSRFTIGMVQMQFEKATENGLHFMPDTQVMDMDTHENVKLGDLSIELIRVTHAIPECSAIVVNTPIGRVINTGDFRLDPEPLDAMPSDITRLRQLGNEGVLLLMSESTNATSPGRTPTEHTLQDSFYDLIGKATGRIFVSIFSSNMNRIQMIINAAAENGRKVALDGRSMMTHAELAVRLGNVKIPSGTLIPLREAASVPDNQLVVVCTGGQGEPNAAMSRMAAGTHQHIKLRKGDSVVISSTPIPGNERSYQEIGDKLASIGVKQFRHPTHQIDGCGPLHVSGHGNRDEHAEMIQLTRPRFLMPVYGGALNRTHHRQVGLENNLAEDQIIMVENGESFEINKDGSLDRIGSVTSGAHLVDQTGGVVPEIVTKDRLQLRDDGFLIVITTIDKQTGRMILSPDIVTRGLIAVQDNADTMNNLRALVRQTPPIAKFSRAKLDLFRQSIKDDVSQLVYEKTGRTPIVVVVVNVVEGNRRTQVPRVESQRV